LANTKSAQKRIRVSQRRRARNKPVQSQTKTLIAKAEDIIFSGDTERATGAVADAVSSLDKAVGKGVLHPNNAARRKSRLVKKLNKAQQATE
jgi:small subunit ribosomal protein S20